MDQSIKLAGLSLFLVTMAAGMSAQAGDHTADDKIAVAKAAISHAEQAGAPETASVPLAAARDELALAEKANAKHDGKPAADWADRANIDALVAEATATKSRADKAAVEFDASLQTLRQEADRAAQSTK